MAGVQGPGIGRVISALANAERPISSLKRCFAGKQQEYRNQMKFRNLPFFIGASIKWQPERITMENYTIVRLASEMMLPPESIRPKELTGSRRR
jgi:hypothetical protein